MKKVVITGALGYLGMELCKVYSGKSFDYEIIAIDKKFFSSRVKQLNNWNIKFKQIDILNFDSIYEECIDADIVFHLAGITDVPTVKSLENKTINAKIKNVAIKGTNNVINSLGDQTKLVFPSTHVIFEGIKEQKKILTEEDTPNPVLAYSSSKYQNELDIAKSCRNYVILRLGSLYGLSGDSTRINIMPNLFAMNSALNKDIKLFGGGKQYKSLVSVFDVARCLEFVGENDEIKNEIFNCVNENTTVKAVAKINKKINKKINIIPTDDEVPNLGYWLDNNKIKNAGFEFLYELASCTEEMIEAWSFNKKAKFNESIVLGADSFEDNRGMIENYYFEDPINMIGTVTSKKGTVRGNHYHPIQTQKCLLVKGSYLSITKDLLDENSVTESRIVKAGELSIIPPNVAHTMVFFEDSILLNLVIGDREHENYGVTHTLKYNLVDEFLVEFILNNYKLDCRACGSKNLDLVLSLGLTPLANNLLSSKNEDFNVYPLEILKCGEFDCFNVQLSVVVPPDEMFKNYLYISSTTEVFRNHFEKLAKKIVKENRLSNKSLVIDIGSNDGIFLEPLKQMGINFLGVDPAQNVAKIANEKGLKTINSYFDKKVVNKIDQKYGKADVVTAFNVFAHSDELYEIALNISKILKKDGIFIFEVQYFLDTLNDLTFDNIYHEHTNYWTFTSLIRFFRDLPLKIYKVEHVDTHGGSLRVYCSNNKKRKTTNSVKEYLNKEIKNGVLQNSTYENFANKVKETKIDSINKITRLKNTGQNIFGYGSPAKATTVLNYFGLNDSFIKYTIDDNYLKHNKFIPGTKIKIIDRKSLDPEKVDKVIVMAWNYFQIIKDKNKEHFHKAEFLSLK